MLLSNFPPHRPAEYNRNEDPLRRNWQIYARRAVKVNDPEWHAKKIAELFPEVPLRLLMDILTRQKGVAEQVDRVLSPYVEEQMGKYFHRYGVSTDYVPQIPEYSRFAFNLLWCGDGLTGRHSMNASYVVRAVSKLVSSDSDPLVLSQAGLLHDIGKGDIPRVILEDATPRDLQGPLYAMNLADPLRPVGKRVESPIDLSEEEAAYFEPLLLGKDKSPQLVKEFGELCASKRRADYRKGIPVRTLLGLASYIFKEGKLPPELDDYVEQYLGPDGKADVAHMIRVFKNHKADLSNIDMILARYGIDGWGETLLQVLQRHESLSFAYVPDYLGCVVARHHNYPLTKRTLSTSRGYMPSPNSLVYTSLTLSDIIVALAECRPYFRNGKPKPLAAIRNILRAEASMHGIHPEMVEAVIDGLLTGDEEENPLEVIFDRCSQILAA